MDTKKIDQLIQALERAKHLAETAKQDITIGRQEELRVSLGELYEAIAIIDKLENEIEGQELGQ